jgi:hypothetical protein
MNRSTLSAFAACMVVLIGGGAAFRGAAAALKYQLTKRPIEAELKLPSTPKQTDRWTCIADRQEGAEMLEALGTQNYITRAFVRNAQNGQADPRVIELHAAYYTGMIDTVPHVPDRCLVGAGFTITGATRNIPMSLDLSSWNTVRLEGSEDHVYSRRCYRTRDSIGPDGKEQKVLIRPHIRLPRGIEDVTLRVTEFASPGGDRKLLAGYFFIANGGIAGKAEDVRALAFDLRADYAYYLKVQFSGSYDSVDELIENASDLLEDLLPDLMLCAPDWYDVLAGDYPEDNPRRAAASK